MSGVYIAVTTFPNSLSDVLTKQQVMSMMPKAGVSCMQMADGCAVRRPGRGEFGGKERKGGAWEKKKHG